MKKKKTTNQSGIKFYNMWCVKFIFETILTEIAQSLGFYQFPLFQIFGQMWKLKKEGKKGEYTASRQHSCTQDS